MTRLKLLCLCSCSVFLLSACQFFQTVDTPVDTGIKAPTAQEKFATGLQNLYQVHSGTWNETFDINLYRTALDYDHWTAAIQENWEDSPSQSLGTIHLNLTLPPATSTAKAAQGIIELNTARTNHDYFFKLANANFAGPDGQALDDLLQNSINQWFSLPKQIDKNSQLSIVQTLLTLSENLRQYPANILTTAKYFQILDATTVQTDEGLAEKMNISLDQEGIHQLLSSLRQYNAGTAIDFDLFQKLLSSSDFTGTLLIDERQKFINDIAGTITLHTPSNTNQNMTIKFHVNLTNANTHVPIAVPTQVTPLPENFLLPQPTSEAVAP